MQADQHEERLDVGAGEELLQERGVVVFLPVVVVDLLDFRLDVVLVTPEEVEGRASAVRVPCLEEEDRRLGEEDQEGHREQRGRGQR